MTMRTDDVPDDVKPSDLMVLKTGIEGADIVFALHQACFPPGSGERWSHTDLCEVLRMPGTLALIASRDDQPLGYGLARFAADECELLSLAVADPQRRSGVAHALVGHLIDLCRNRSMARLFLEVREDNEAARALYNKSGFKIVGRRPRYYKMANGTAKDAVTMAYSLND
ncbi:MULTISPECIES: ribosomal protein S18-alanine N-acetyltransferase [unclassified Iodidimonas]|jgi:ribosomal-protein-alanine N-acetyltransferase|uniref:ribosomal protein S18-alanine N-acetyltransferase n=1 Tax=unclassified Iodidimonas TaxID=2626145 RepID=UPI00248285E4|nr:MULTISPECIES: ribosomal protein S18-alanine N-acetyltransferase [unclassified Iodidimonas]